MKRIIIASHGLLCEGILNTGKMIAGEDALKDIKTISICMKDSHNDVKERIDGILTEYGINDEILALTDVYGGSITSVLTEYIGKRNIHIITGVNLGMLLEACFMLEQMDFNDLIPYLLDQGKSAIHYVNEELSCAKEDEIWLKLCT